jgi:hypothetical protein
MNKILYLILVLGLFLTSCGDKDIGDSTEESSESSETQENDDVDIGELVIKMYKYANDYDYENMKKCFNASITDDSKRLTEYIDSNTKNGTIKNVEVLYQNIEYEAGIVRIKKIFDDGTTENKGIELEKENGEWLIIFNEFEKEYIPLPEPEIAEGFWYDDNYGYLLSDYGGGYNIIRFIAYASYNKESDKLYFESNNKEYLRTSNGNTVLEGLWGEEDYNISISLKNKLYRIVVSEQGLSYKKYLFGIYNEDNNRFYRVESLDINVDESNYETLELEDYYLKSTWNTETGRMNLALEYDEENKIFVGVEKSNLDISSFE